MPIAAEAVPALLHVSLLLFFVGLGDSTLNINTTIGLSTVVPIGLCGMLYMFITFAPVIYPQSPYQTSFSGAIWYAIQKSGGRIFKDRDGGSKSVSTNMARGQMELSMEETKERLGRDKRAIRWLLDNLTEDAEIESLAMSIPGSFNGEWSLQVWTESSKFKEDDTPFIGQHSSRLRTIRNVLCLIPRQFRTCTTSRSPRNAAIHQRGLHSTDIARSIATTSIHERNTIRELCMRIGHLLDTCKNRAAFASDELWRRRARVCVEATLTLVCYADAELSWFGLGDILRTLGDIGNFEGMLDLSRAGRDQTFVVRWTCLSIIALRATLDSVSFKEHARLAVEESFEGLGHSDRADEAAEKIALEFDENLKDPWEFSPGSDNEMSSTEDTVRKMETFLKSVESKTVNLNETIDKISQRITYQLPGVHFDFPDSKPFLGQTFWLFRRTLGYVFDLLSSIDRYREQARKGHAIFTIFEDVSWPKNLLQLTLWSLQDLRDGGLAFAVELFFLALWQLLSTYPSQESYSVLYIATFKAITSDRRRYKHTLGTQRILLHAVASDQGILRMYRYPNYITDEFWELLGDMLEGQTGPHIDRAVQQLTDLQREDGDRYRAKALAVIARLRASCSQGSSIPTA